jgi:ribosome-binding factor A
MYAPPTSRPGSPLVTFRISSFVFSIFQFAISVFQFSGVLMTDAGRRVDRLADQIRGEVAGMITAELKDPRIGFTTVTRVELSHDLYHARVWVSVLGDEAAQQRTLEGLSSAAGYVRHEVSHRLRLRRVPELIFVLDRGPEEASRIEALLRDRKGN